MKRILETAGVFLATIVITHWVGIILFTLTTPFRVTDMTSSQSYSVVSIFISLLVALVITAHFDDTYEKN
jgi:hypothetical protein